jgi:hypothetical protein
MLHSCGDPILMSCTILAEIGVIHINQTLASGTTERERMVSMCLTLWT